MQRATVLLILAMTAACIGRCDRAVAQTYFAPTVGVQNTYTGACVTTTCSGTYYDNGGAAGAYAANVNAIFRTFCPNTAGMCMRASFTFFDMNDTFILCGGPGGCCDYLQVLNGPAQNSPALYNGCTTSPGVVTANNASGCLTFRFISDNTIQLGGWACTLSCVPCGIGPSGTTNADCNFATPICSNAAFSDASSGPGIVAEGCSGCNTSEVYTNWYQIQIQTSGTLAFTINPNVNTDDFDPVVYGPNLPCSALGTPVRCSYAIAAGNGNTGLGNGALDNSEDVFGNQWVAPLNVLAGQTYYILINGWSATSGTNGFALTWTGTASLDCTITPVEFLSFGATCEAGRPLLTWATATEHNNSRFNVQRSSDGETWQDVGSMAGAGNSFTHTEYLFMDPVPVHEALMYYRLQQVDFDGRSSFSEVVSLDHCASTIGSIIAMPNPTDDLLQVNVELAEHLDGPATLELRDELARTVLQQRVVLEDGRATVMLNLAPVASGTYALALYHDGCGSVPRTRVVRR